MLREDDRGKMGRRAVTADTDSLAFQLFEPRDPGLGEDCRIVINLHSGNQRKVEARQAGLHYLTDAHQRRISARQCLDRELAAAEKDRLDVKAVFFEQPFVLRHPDMTLAKTERWITESDFL